MKRALRAYQQRTLFLYAAATWAADFMHLKPRVQRKISRARAGIFFMSRVNDTLLEPIHFASAMEVWSMFIEGVEIRPIPSGTFTPNAALAGREFYPGKLFETR